MAPKELEWRRRHRPMSSCGLPDVTHSGLPCPRSVGTAAGTGRPRRSCAPGVRTPPWPWTSCVPSLGLDFLHLQSEESVIPEAHSGFRVM